MSAENSFICCFCGKTFIGWGNDPWPINKSKNAECCDECNTHFVLPARLQAFCDDIVKGGNVND